MECFIPVFFSDYPRFELLTNNTDVTSFSKTSNFVETLIANMRSLCFPTIWGIYWNKEKK